MRPFDLGPVGQARTGLRRCGSEALALLPVQVAVEHLARAGASRSHEPQHLRRVDALDTGVPGGDHCGQSFPQPAQSDQFRIDAPELIRQHP